MPEPRTNESALVEMAIAGAVSEPSVRPGQYIPHPDGRATVLPGMYGITYNVRCGDRAFGWAGDHVEPGCSIDDPDPGRHHALHYLTCIGNEAMVTSGEAAGARGVVIGEHARILVQFEPDVHEAMTVGDGVQIFARGRGLELPDYRGVELKKMSPRLFHAMGVSETNTGKLHVKVAMELPIRIMGSGAELNAEYVDQDLMSGDRALMAELGVDQMRMGDLIAIRHADHHFGRSYREGAVSIALCIHGDSVMTGHGPGILTLMTSRAGDLEFDVDPEANIATLLDLGAAR